jgi:TatD DNase family protein
MLLIDTHTHLNLGEFGADRLQVLTRAADAGVGAMIVVGCDVGSSRVAVEMAERHDNLWAAVGIHPSEAHQGQERSLAQIAELAGHPRVVAIGESGIDLTRPEPPAALQIPLFEQSLALSAQFGKPLLVHSRKGASNIETLAVLERLKTPGQRVVRHCFSEDEAVLERYLALGCMVSIAGNVTYPRNRQLREAVAAVPADRLLLETDCPWLPPQGWRGRRNEPARLVETAAQVAQARGEQLESLAEQTTQNACLLFDLPQLPR